MLTVLRYFNDTWIYNSSATFCTGTTVAACLTLRGGLYDSNASSTSSQSPTNVYAAGGDPSDTQPTLMTHIWYNAFVTDDLIVGNNSLADFPIGMPGFAIFDPYVTQDQFGLGWNSTLLNALLTAKKIASRSYSWWWGLNGASQSAQMDGQIVFGGYDSAKVQGQNYTQPLLKPWLNCPSGMSVIISDMELNFPNGTSTSIMDSPDAITTCIQPEYPIIATLPWKPYYNNFETFTGTQNVGRALGEGIAFYGMIYPTDTVYQGDLTITLSNGFSARFPNDLLVVPQTTVQSDGSIQTNSSFDEVMLNPTLGVNDNDFSILGRYFFQAAYLTVDFDSQTFTLSQAVATSDTKLTALGGECSTPYVNVPAGANATHTATSPSHSASKEVRRPGGVSTGDIVGAVVGSAFGAALLAALAVMFYMRRRRRIEGAVGQESSMSLAPHQPPEIYNNHEGGIFHESAAREVQEMAAVDDRRELTGESKPAEADSGEVVKERYKPLPALNSSPAELG